MKQKTEYIKSLFICPTDSDLKTSVARINAAIQRGDCIELSKAATEDLTNHFWVQITRGKNYSDD